LPAGQPRQKHTHHFGAGQLACHEQMVMYSGNSEVGECSVVQALHGQLKQVVPSCCMLKRVPQVCPW
jgi:hypothetical protein